MIQPFKCQETAKIWTGKVSTKLPHAIQPIARKTLRMLNNAKQLSDVKIPPTNHLEALKGHLKEFYSIRINQQWRMCFRWGEG